MNSNRLLCVLCPFIALSGCATLEDRLKQSIDEAHEIQAKCAPVPLTELDAKAQFKTSLSELARAHLGVVFRVPGEKTTLSTLLDDLQRDLADVLAETKSQSTRDAIAKLRVDANQVRSSISAIRESIKTIVKEAADQRKLTSANAFRDYQNLLVSIALAARGELLAARASMETLANDAEAILQSVSKTEGKVSLAATRFADDIHELVFALRGLVKIYDAGIAGAAFNITSLDFKNTVQVLIDDIENYEIARLTLNVIHRASRVIQKKLDEIDQKAWFALSFAEWGTSDKLAKSLAKEFKELNDDASIPASFKSALFVAACAHLYQDPNKQDSDTVRADVLLHPLYKAAMVAFAKKRPGDTVDVADISSVAMEKSANLSAVLTASKQVHLTLTSADLTALRNSLRTAPKENFIHQQAIQSAVESTFAVQRRSAMVDRPLPFIQ